MSTLAERTLAMRFAAPADIGALHTLVERAYRGEAARAGWTHEADLIEGPRTSRAALAAVLADRGERVLLFEEDDTLVACVQLSERPDARAYLGMLAVDPLRQAAGLGRRVIAAAEREGARLFGARTIEMSVVSQRTELIAWYQRRGYRLTGEARPFPIPLDPPLTLIVLERVIG